MRKAEESLQLAVANHIVTNYPNVLFRTDAGGIKLPIGLAKKLKDMNGGRRGWPDMFIAEPKGVKAECAVLDGEKYMKNGEVSPIQKAQFIEQKYGLFIELKKEGTRIFKKDGTLVSDEHIREQFDMLTELRSKGYVAEFACGYDEAVKLIDDYLNGN